MRWQKTARLAIATFVTVFAAVVLFSMRQPRPDPVAAEVPRADDTAKFQTLQGINYEKSENGRLQYRMKAQRHLGYADGRQRLGEVELTFPDRQGKTIVVHAAEAEITSAPGRDLDKALFRKNVRLTTDDGVEMRTETADYVDATGVVNVPGAVQFTRGRLSGKGVGATYDRNRDVLWLLSQVHITVAPDKSGHGAAQATAGGAGLARSDNYLKLSRNAQVVSDGQTMSADDMTVKLKPDGETVEAIELRNNARITESGALARNMAATDIDLSYAADGRTLQHARLFGNGVVELPATAGAGARRISASTIALAMAADGATLTALDANENVVVDLPAAGEQPGKQIRAAALQASGPEGRGLQHAAFSGAVEYRETRPARGAAPAIDRTARAARLTLATAPGLGEIERAEFRGNFKFVDASQVTAEAPRGIYFVNGDRLELSPSQGDPGPTPTVNDGQFLVEARQIQLSPASRKLAAETDVRSTIQPTRAPAASAERRAPSGGRIPPVPPPGAAEGRMPALLKRDRPVYVAANRLTYDGAQEATYTGNARLWQDQAGSKINADTIVLNDRTGNLTARGSVSTFMLLEETDPASKAKRTSQMHATSDLLVYDDAKRLAVYTGSDKARATMRGPYGDVTANRIDIYLEEGGDELEHAEAHGKVVVKEGLRTVTGDRLIYTAANDTYVMTGNPVEGIEQDTAKSCKKTTGTTLTFQRSVATIRADTTGFVPLRVEPVPCPAERRN